MAGVLRTLQGISYWIMEEPKSIYEFVNSNIRREWAMDVRDSGGAVEGDPWLRTLPERQWTLEVARMTKIHLDPKIMNYKDNAKRYDFKTELAKRRTLLRKSIEFGSVIWPLIVDEKLILRDGYCRYAALTEMQVSQTFCYLGTNPTR